MDFRDMFSKTLCITKSFVAASEATYKCFVTCLTCVFPELPNVLERFPAAFDVTTICGMIFHFGAAFGVI